MVLSILGAIHFVPILHIELLYPYDDTDDSGP